MNDGSHILAAHMGYTRLLLLPHVVLNACELLPAPILHVEDHHYHSEEAAQLLHHLHRGDLLHRQTADNEIDESHLETLP